MAYGSVKVDSIVTSTQTVTVDDLLASGDIGTSVQAYDADTAKTDVAQTFTAQQTFGELKETVYTLGTTGSIALDPRMVRSKAAY